MARTRQCTHTEITSTGCVAATVAANVAATVYSDRYTVYLSIRNYKNVWYQTVTGAWRCQLAKAVTPWVSDVSPPPNRRAYLFIVSNLMAPSRTARTRHRLARQWWSRQQIPPNLRRIHLAADRPK